MNKTKQFFLFSFVSFILIGSFLILQNPKVLADSCDGLSRGMCDGTSGCDWVGGKCVSSEGGGGVILCSSSNCSACVDELACQETNYCVWNGKSCQAPAAAPVSPISSWCTNSYCGGCDQTECATAAGWPPLNALCQWENNFCGSQLMDSAKFSNPWEGSQSEKKIFSADGTEMYGVSQIYYIHDGGGHTPYLDINVLGPATYQCTAVSLDQIEINPTLCPPEAVQAKNQNDLLAKLFSIAKAAPPGQCWQTGVSCSTKYPWFIKRAELYTLATDKPDNYDRCRMRMNVVDRNGNWINQGLVLPKPIPSPAPPEEGDKGEQVFNENNQNFSFQDLFKNLAANFRDLIPKALAQIPYDSIYGSFSSYQVCGYQTGYWAQARAMPVKETLPSAGARIEATVDGNWVDIVKWWGQVRYWGERMLMKSFSVDKTIIQPKETVTLNWEVLNAALSNENYPEVYVFIGDAQCAAPYNCQPNSKFFAGKEIGEKGSLTVYPNQTTNFYLIAKGASGEGVVYFISDPSQVTVSNEPPPLSCSLTANPSSGNIPLNGVDLTANVSGLATGTINYTFYCNRSDNGTNITSGYAHKKDNTKSNPYTAPDVCDYSSSGAYTAKVIVERGSWAAECRTAINVSATPSPTTELTCNFAWEPEEVKVQSSVNFFDQTRTPSGTTLTNWSWTFPDATPATSTSENPQNVIFNTAGDKDVTLHVTNSDAKTCSLTQKVQVKTISPHWKEVVPQ